MPTRASKSRTDDGPLKTDRACHIFRVCTAPLAPKATNETSTRRAMNLLPGGYNLIHVVFWGVVGLVAVGTNAVAIILVTGLALLLLESVGRA